MGEMLLLWLGRVWCEKFPHHLSVPLFELSIAWVTYHFET